MTPIDIRWVPTVTIQFTKDEVSNLMKLAVNHYDYICQKAALPGPEGFLNGLRNSEVAIGTHEWDFSVGELQILCKIMETDLNNTLGDIRWPLIQILTRVNARGYQVKDYQIWSENASL